ncbi:hypothetical protein HDU76_012914 [Blyttiomyces sp. JEL0837]|nr:hypothetical protein HDU76_012914 [Blyttiomyces sp. JEL0837]
MNQQELTTEELVSTTDPVNNPVEPNCFYVINIQLPDNQQSNEKIVPPWKVGGKAERLAGQPVPKLSTIPANAFDNVKVYLNFSHFKRCRVVFADVSNFEYNGFHREGVKLGDDAVVQLGDLNLGFHAFKRTDGEPDNDRSSAFARAAARSYKRVITDYNNALPDSDEEVEEEEEDLRLAYLSKYEGEEHFDNVEQSLRMIACSYDFFGQFAEEFTALG